MMCCVSEMASEKAVNVGADMTVLTLAYISFKTLFDGGGQAGRRDALKEPETASS